jgi:hypothetical protein
MPRWPARCTTSPLTRTWSPRSAVALADGSAFSIQTRVADDRAIWALRTWLDSWSGIGHLAVGMARQGYDLQLLAIKRNLTP